MALIDMWAGAWSDLWGIDVPDAQTMGDYYNTQVEIYVDTAFGTLVDILNARRDPTTLSELKGHGAGSFKISKNDPKIQKNPKLLEYRNYVKIRLNGDVIGGFIIQNKRSIIIGEGEESAEAWEISGEGPRSWSRDASVYPSKGLKNSSAETRYFNFSTERGSWYEDAKWPYATMRWGWDVAGNPKGHAPAEWPDVPGARWIWNSPYDGNDPLGYCYFRHEFTTTGAPGSLTKFAFFVAIDDSGEIYVDGELKATLEGHAWYETTRVELELEPGDHVIGIKAYNYQADGPGELIAALLSYGDPNAPSPATLINHTGMANTWRVNGYPEVEPGWTIGDVLLTLLNEAKDRGVRFANNFTPTFNDTVDSSGTPWADPVSWSFSVGSTFEDVITSAEELGCDIWVDPDTLQIHARAKRGSDRSLVGQLNGTLIEARRNRILNPRQISSGVQNEEQPRYSWPRTWTTGINDHPLGITTACRVTLSAASQTGAGRGFDWYANMDTTPVNNASWTAVPVSPGDVIEQHAWARSNRAMSFSIGMRFININTLSYTTAGIFSYALDVPAMTWAEVVNTATAPAGTTHVIFRGVSNRDSVSFVQNDWMEQTGLYIGLPGKYFDGSYPTDEVNLAKYRYEGAVGSSASIMDVPAFYGDAVIFQAGKNLTGADENGQAEIANTLMLRTPEGWTEATAQDPTSLEKYGRVETQMSTNLTAGGAQALVQELFRQKALPEVSATFEIVPIKGHIPFKNFNVGDWVSAPGDIPGVLETRRVMSISFAEDEATGLPRYAVEFDTIFKDRQTELEKWVSRMSNSSAIGGGFTNSSNLPSTVVTPPPGNPQGAIPDAPTGLTVSSLGKWTPDGGSSSDFGLTWNAVVTGTGFGAVEVVQYEVWGRLSTESNFNHLSTVFDTMSYMTGFRPGDTWVFKVRAISKTGGPGNFSVDVSLMAEAPVVALGKPSTPTLQSGFGVISVSWDGKIAGVTAPPYVKYVRVERKPTSGSTWTSVGALVNYTYQDVPGASGESYDYRLVAVDIYGRDSTPSDPATKVVSGVDLGDLDQEVADAIQAAQDAADAAAAQAGAAANRAADAQLKADLAGQLVANPKFNMPQPDVSYSPVLWNNEGTGGRLIPGAGFAAGVNIVDGNIVFLAESAQWSTSLSNSNATDAYFLPPGNTVKIVVDYAMAGVVPATIELGRDFNGTAVASTTLTQTEGHKEFTYKNTTASYPSIQLKIKAGPTNGTGSYVNIVNISAYNITEAANAQATADLAQATANAANAAAIAAQTSADGKNKIWYQTTAPTGTSHKVGDTWFDTDDGNKIYRWDGSIWNPAQFGTNAIANAAITNALIADATIQNAKIANLDAAKITTGTLSADRIGARSITADKLIVGDMTNYIPNALLEGVVSGLPASWFRRSGATTASTIVNSPGLPGASWKLDGVSTEVSVVSDWFEVVPGASYRASISSLNQLTGSSPNAYYRFEWRQKDRTTASATATTSFTLPLSGTWTTSGYDLTIPTDAYYSRVLLIHGNNNTGGSWWSGNYSLRQKSSGELIVDGSITAIKIQAGSITGDRLTAGTITGDKIAAGTISAGKLLVSNLNNLVEDPSFEYSNVSGVAWTLSNGATIGTTNPRTGSRALTIPTQASAIQAARSVNAFAVEAGEKYRLAAWVRTASGTAASSGVVLRMAYGATEASTTTTSPDIVLTPEDATTTYVRTSDIWMVPAGAKFARLDVIMRDTVTGKTYYVDDISIYKMSDGELIVDGSITAEKIGAEAITAEKIQAGSIATMHLQSDAVTADKIAAGAVTAESIAAGAIQSNHITAGAIQVNHLSPAVGSSLDISANSTVNIILGRVQNNEDGLGSVTSDVTDLKTYYSFTTEGAIIGNSDSSFKLFLKNDRIEILENNIPVSYWDSGRMVVPTFVGEEVVLANHKLEKYDTGTVVRRV